MKKRKLTEFKAIAFDAEAESWFPESSSQETRIRIDSIRKQLFGSHRIVAVDGQKKLRLQIPPRYTHDFPDTAQRSRCNRLVHKLCKVIDSFQ